MLKYLKKLQQEVIRKTTTRGLSFPLHESELIMKVKGMKNVRIEMNNDSTNGSRPFILVSKQ